MTVKDAKQEIRILPMSEKYHLLTGDPEIVGQVSGTGYSTACGMLSKRLIELTEKTTTELGSLGHIIFYDKEDKRVQRKIISVFRKDCVEVVTPGFMGQAEYSYPKLYPLHRHFYMSTKPEGITRYIIHPSVTYDLLSKKELRDHGLTHDDVVAFQWNSDLTLCSMLDISLLDPELRITAEPLPTKGLGKKDKKTSTRLAVFFVECTHSFIRSNMDQHCEHRGYNPDETVEYFERINR